MGLVENEPYQWDVVTPQSGRLFPQVAITKQTSHHDRVSRSVPSAFSPDANFDEAAAQFVNGSLWHCSVPRIGDLAQPVRKIRQPLALLCGKAGVIGQSQGQEVAESGQVVHVSRPKEVRYASVVRAQSVDVEAQGVTTPFCTRLPNCA